MIVDNQTNIKVHFAATEQVHQFHAVRAVGGRYSLYTAYPFIERMMFDKIKAPIIPCEFKNKIHEIPQFVIQNSRHTIQDSGLFTLMFGSQKGNKDKKFLDRYCENLIEFTKKYGEGSSVVEMDTQKILGIDSAWEYRMKMAEALPNRMINVFHLEDKQKGLDRLIEYSDYIAISVPELRLTKKKGYLIQLANYIKNKKPKIDIHLLGFTEKNLLSSLKFCSSCDSSSYTSGVRYGYIDGRKISTMKSEEVQKIVTKKDYELLRQYISEATANGFILNIKSELDKYRIHAGSQN